MWLLSGKKEGKGKGFRVTRGGKKKREGRIAIKEVLALFEHDMEGRRKFFGDDLKKKKEEMMVYQNQKNHRENHS